MSEPIEINVLQFEVGVNMGDHAETVCRAHSVDPAETIGSVVERLLKQEVWQGLNLPPKREPQSDWRLEIRVAMPKVVPADAQ